MLRSMLILTVCACLTGLLAHPTAAAAALEQDRSLVDTPRRVYATNPADAWSRSGLVQFDRFIEQIAGADVVFLGEYHDDPATHRLQLDILTALADARNGRVTLTMEQFERDVQAVLGTYLANGLTEEEFLADSRPWNNYERDYKPLVEFCHDRSLPVIAANIPRPLASRITQEGFEAAWESYTAEEQQWVARETSHQQDMYWDIFSSMMSGGHGMQMDVEVVMKYFAAQCIKDDTMAESITTQLESVPYRQVVHTNGSFHSDYGLGTVSRVQARLELARLVTVAIRPVVAWNDVDINAESMPANMGPDVTVEASGKVVPVADYIIFVQAPEYGGADPVPPNPVVEEEAPEMVMPPPAMPAAEAEAGDAAPDVEQVPAAMPPTMPPTN